MLARSQVIAKRRAARKAKREAKAKLKAATLAAQEGKVKRAAKRRLKVGAITIADAEGNAKRRARLKAARKVERKLKVGAIAVAKVGAQAGPRLATADFLELVSKLFNDDEKASAVPAPLDMYQELQVSLRQLEVQFTQQLEQMLDPPVYQAAIVNGEVDQFNRYLIDKSGKEKAIFYYKSLLNLLRDSQRLLGPVSAVHQNALGLLGKGLFGRARAIPTLNADVTKLLAAYVNLYETINSLKLDQALPQLFSVNEIFKKCKKIANLIFPVQTLLKQVQSNPVVATLRHQAPSLQRLLKIQPSAQPLTVPPVAKADTFDKWSDNLLNLQQALQNILVELVGKDMSREALQSVVKTNTTIHGILARLKAFSQVPHSLSSMISLIRDLYPMANELTANFPQSLVATNKVLQNYIFIAAQQLNIVLRELFLRLDSLESDYYLKEKYLFSLGKMEKRDSDKFIIKIAQEFNAWVAGMNAEFKPEESFPYTEAILEQRQGRVVSYQANKNLGGKQRELRLVYLNKRVVASQQALAAEAAVAAKQKQEQAAEFLRSAGYKLELVYGDNVRPHLDDLAPSTLYLHLQDGALQCTLKKDRQVEQLALESYTIQVVYGRVNPDNLLPNKLYLYLEEESLQCVVKKAGKIKPLDLTRLDPAQAEAIKSSLKVAARTPLTGGQQKALYQLAALQGYSSEGGLSAAVVRDLTLILKASVLPPSPELRAAVFEQTAKQGYVPWVSKKETLIALIDQRIAELKKEMDAALVLLTKTKSIKKELLQELKAVAEQSFDEAGGFDQETLKAKLKARSYLNLDLLFEGRTGKMLNEFRYFAARRGDEATFIQKHQARLDDTKKRGFWFFAERRSQKLTERIAALELLKKWLSTPGYRLEDALEVLQVRHLREFNCLITKDQAVLDELRKIEKQLPDGQVGKRLIKALETPNLRLVQAKQQLIEDYQDRLRKQKEAILVDGGYFSFFNSRKVKLLENRIAGLEKLKLWLKKDGYYVDNALLAVEFSHPAEYQWLKDEIALLKGIAALEKPLAPALFQAKLKLVTDYQQSLNMQKIALPPALGVLDARKVAQFTACITARITALDVLKTWLNKPGYNIDHALLAIESVAAPEYALIKEEAALLDRIREFEAAPVAAPVAAKVR